MNNPTITKSQRVRFEEVTPTNEIVVYFDAQLPDLIAGTGLPIFPGYDDLDSIQFAYITLPSGNTVVLGQYGNAPEIGVDLYVELVGAASPLENRKNNSTAIFNIPALVVETLRYLAIPRATAVWFHSDYETEIEDLFSQDGELESIPKIPTEELALSNEYEPIDCFYYALKIYTRPKLPEHWAMLQHNLGLAYFDRIKGERWENLQKSIECFNKSLEIFTQNEFPEKWWINQEDLAKSQRLIKQILVKDILDRPRPYQKLRCADLRGANLSGADLRSADLRGANLNFANLDGTNFGDANPIGFDKGVAYVRVSTAGAYRVGRVPKRKYSRRQMKGVKGANLSDANLSNSNLRSANLRGANLKDANLKGADVRGAKFGYNLGISESMEQDLIERGAIFDDSPPGDRSESRTLVPR
jgi:tetratricopeptide (TPR) repeat protein